VSLTGPALNTASVPVRSQSRRCYRTGCSCRVPGRLRRIRKAQPPSWRATGRVHQRRCPALRRRRRHGLL